MPDRLQEIRARLDAATPGPWWSEESTRGHDIWHTPTHRETGEPMSPGRVGYVYLEQTADLIAHAPADIAWLLDEVERQSRYRENWYRTYMALCMQEGVTLGEDTYRKIHADA